MRLLQLLLVCGAVAGAQAASEEVPQLASTIISDVNPTESLTTTYTNDTMPWYSIPKDNETPSGSLPTSSPNSTSTGPIETAGGAIPPQLKSSVAGLIGFFIVGLVTL